MSSSSSMVPTDLMKQFLLDCAIDSRRWLRSEMESLLDPLVDDLFKRINTNFADYITQQMAASDSSQFLSKQNVQVTNREFNHTPILNLSTQSSNISEVATKHPVNFNHGVEEFNNNEPNNHRNSNTIVKNEPLFTPHDEHNLPYPDQNVMEQWLEEDCDCDQCIDGGLTIKSEQDDDDDDDIERIDNVNHNCKLNYVSSANEAAKRKLTDLSSSSCEMKSQEKQIITLKLQCFQPNCSLEFVHKDQLNEHLLQVHKIHKFRCYVKDCNCSFDNGLDLGNHLQEAHPDIFKWKCDECEKHFKTHQSLTNHLAQYHQKGLFQCPVAECTFVDEHRGKIYTHFQNVHSNNFICNFDGCGKKYKRASALKEHRRVHLGIKPYRCKWPLCELAFTSHSSIVNHIRFVHFFQNVDFKTANSLSQRMRYKNGDFGNPKDFIEVVRELCLM